MPLSALALVVVAALAHSLWNLWLKSGQWSLAHWLWSVVVGVALLSPTLLVWGVADVSGRAWVMIAVSGLFQAAYCVLLTAAYDAGELSLVYPIVRGTAPVVVAALSAVLLGERLPLLGATGIALVVAGLFATHAGGRSWRELGRVRAAGLAVLAGLAIVGYSLIDKQAVGLVPPPLYLLLVHVVCLVALVAVLRIRGTSLVLPPGRRDRQAILGVGVISFGAYMLVLFAMRLAPVSYVVAGREVSVVFAAILGVAVLGEPLRPARLIGAVAVFLGLVALASSR